jgi:DNA-binding LacI/PurR family transcriptional regulator
MTAGGLVATNTHTDRITRVLYENLVKGKVRVGDRLPSIRQLGKTFNVQRETVRRAMGSLAEEGFLEMRPGSGTYVKAIPENGEVDVKVMQILLWMPRLNQFNSDAFKIFEHKPGQEYRFTVVNSIGSLQQWRISDYNGVIAVVPTHDDLEGVKKIVGDSVPIVSLSRSYLDVPVSSVLEDNFNASYDLTKWLLYQGHRRIAFLGDGRERMQSFSIARLHGWKAAIEEAGLDASALPLHWITPCADEAMFGAMLPLFEKPDFDAIFCSMGIILEEALRHIMLRGMDMVERRAVACFDTNFGNSGVAYAFHDLQHLIDSALELLRRTTDPMGIETIHVPMKMYFPK